MQNENIPKIIEKVGFDFDWDERKVWNLKLPIKEMPIKKLSWHFNVPFLWENGIYNLKPRDVIENPEKHKKEYDRTMGTDLVFPIDIMKNKGRWLILDGLHRLMKASILGMEIVKIRKVPRKFIPDIEKNTLLP